MAAEVDGNLQFNGKLGVGKAPVADLHTTGNTSVGAPTSALADGSMGNGEVHFWIDESGNNLNFKVKYSNGTVKSGAIALT